MLGVGTLAAEKVPGILCAQLHCWLLALLHGLRNCLQPRTLQELLCCPGHLLPSWGNLLKAKAGGTSAAIEILNAGNKMGE